MNIAIFGGAFDPVHNEHLKVIDLAKAQLEVDRLIVVPCFLPPFDKVLYANFAQRTEMLRLALCDRTDIDISTIESEMPGKSYSYDSVLKLKKAYGADKVYFLIGSDCLPSLHRWHRISELKTEVEFVVLPREGYGVQDCPFIVLDGLGLKTSSSEIKGRLFALHDASEDLPPQVAAYIKTHGLYRDYDEIIERLLRSVSEATFMHSVRTALFALRFASSLSLPFDKVFKAAILHDNAKGREGKTTCGVAAVQHQYDGATFAKTEFSIADTDVLAAISTHTTGAPEMSTLQKLIYLADILEDARDYQGVELLRDAVEKDFEKGFVAAVRHCFEHVKISGKPIHGLTEACLKYYCKQGEI